MWRFFNATFNILKRYPLFKLIYRVSWIPPLYHFFIAATGALLYRFPSRKITVLGITGTKGKTTVAELTAALLESSGAHVALLSSVRVRIGDQEEKNMTGNTMPGRFFLQSFLRRAVRAGCSFAVVEVTSQGATLHRHRFIRWKKALITNIHPEHIESHGSYEAYRDAKLSFLRYVADAGGEVFINQEDERSAYFVKKLRGKQTSLYSSISLPPLPPHAEEVFPGAFNRENIAAAVVLAKSFGVKEENIISALQEIRGIPGRMEYISKNPTILVDYAHTPDSLEAVYKTLRIQLANGDGPAGGRLLCVLGSAGGGRDKWKRPEMGRIAGTYCDEIFLTDEDPYDEDPGKIIEQVAGGIAKAEKKEKPPSVRRILDRKEAIRAGVGEAKGKDVVIITGKGSESFLHVKNGEKIPWSDAKYAREAMKSLK